MKVTGPGSVRPSTPTRCTEKATRASSESFAVANADHEASVAKVAAGTPLADVSGLLALQEVSDSTDGRSQGLRRGRDLLQMLEQVRLSLLAGAISESQLSRMLHIVRLRREKASDPRLEGILRDIELRAAVELAKFQRMRDQKPV